MTKDITLTVDYHDHACVIRWYDHSTQKDQVFAEVLKAKKSLNEIVDALRLVASRQGHVVWIQESTTGWARVQELLRNRVDFRLANVVQMPLPPKGRRRKTDKVDTARMQREHLNGRPATGLPTSGQVASTPSISGLPRTAGGASHVVAELD